MSLPCGVSHARLFFSHLRYCTGCTPPRLIHPFSLYLPIYRLPNPPNQISTPSLSLAYSTTYSRHSITSLVLFIYIWKMNLISRTEWTCNISPAIYLSTTLRQCFIHYSCFAFFFPLCKTYSRPCQKEANQSINQTSLLHTSLHLLYTYIKPIYLIAQQHPACIPHDTQNSSCAFHVKCDLRTTYICLTHSRKRWVGGKVEEDEVASRLIWKRACVWFLRDYSFIRVVGVQRCGFLFRWWSGIHYQHQYSGTRI